MCDLQHTDLLFKPDTSDTFSSSYTHLRFTAGVLSSSPPSLDSPPPPCTPEVALESTPGGGGGRGEKGEHVMNTGNKMFP